MQKSKLVKAAACAMVLVSTLSLKTAKANAAWKKDSIGWWNSEGTSYSTDWKKIDGYWYYFYKNDDYGKKGYMAHDTIIDGYFLNNNGVLVIGLPEIKAYSDLLKDTALQKNNGLILMDGKSTITENKVIDIDQDGVYEMLVHNGTCAADEQISVVKYYNGNISVEHVSAFDGGYAGYSKSSKIFFVISGNMGYYYTNGYTIENNKLKQVFSTTDEEVYSNDSQSLNVIEHNYTLNGQKISKAQYDKYFNSFGKIEK